jgi:hypothetical protein
MREQNSEDEASFRVINIEIDKPLAYIFEYNPSKDMGRRRIANIKEGCIIQEDTIDKMFETYAIPYINKHGLQ